MEKKSAYFHNNMRTKYYIETTFETRLGYRYPQPVDRLNGKKWNNYAPESFEYKNWAEIKKHSREYDHAKVVSNYDSEYWENDLVKEKTLNSIHDFILNESKEIHGAETQLLPFEIFLLNDGFEIYNFGHLNAYNPTRGYRKGRNYVCMILGYTPKFRFCLNTQKIHYVDFHLSNKQEDYQDAINGRLNRVYPEAFTCGTKTNT